jgi:hypothetical protein
VPILPLLEHPGNRLGAETKVIGGGSTAAAFINNDTDV